LWRLRYIEVSGFVAQTRLAEAIEPRGGSPGVAADVRIVSQRVARAARILPKNQAVRALCACTLKGEP